MAAARSKVGILQPGCPRIALASCPARAAQRLATTRPCADNVWHFSDSRSSLLQWGERAPGLRSEGSWLAAELLRAGLEPGLIVELEADPGSLMMIRSSSGALASPPEPPTACFSGRASMRRILPSSSYSSATRCTAAAAVEGSRAAALTLMTLPSAAARHVRAAERARCVRAPLGPA